MPEASRSGRITVLSARYQSGGAKPLLLAKAGLHPQIRRLAGERLRVLSCACRSTLRNAIRRAWRETRPMMVGSILASIYCRPVCPVRPARSANVSFFPSAAAAEAAGFRPCLRCRPETAPFSSAWIGSRATVERALRLIVEERALDQEGATCGAVAFVTR